MKLKMVLAGLKGAVQGAMLSRPEHLRYADVLSAAVEDGVLTEDEIDEIRAAREAADGKIPEAKKVAVFRQLRDAILDDGVVTQDELESAQWLASILGITHDEAAGDLVKLETLMRACAISEGRAEPIDVGGVRLQKAEVACLKIDATLMGVKKRRVYVGGSQGVSFRIAKGVSYRVGAIRGHAETVEEDVVEAEGDLIVTTKRLIFSSLERSFAVALGKIVNVNLYLDGVMVHSDSRQKPYFFLFPNNDGELFGAALNWAEKQQA